MPARKHNMFAIKLISVAVGLITTITGIIATPWDKVLQFGHSVMFLYENIDHLEHVVDDSHQVLDMKAQVTGLEVRLDSLKKELFVTTSRDSLIHIIELFNRGKMPYDSIWRKSESGHWYKTTVEDHYKYEHND